MNQNYYYVLSVRIIIETSYKELRFEQFIKSYKEASLLKSRENALDGFNDLINNLLEDSDSFSDAEKRKRLNKYFYNPNLEINNNSKLPESLFNHISVYIASDENKDLYIPILEYKYQKSEIYYPPVSIINLESEVELFNSLGYDLQGLSYEIEFLNDEEYLEGYAEKALGTHVILPIPFDWSNYNLPNWWTKEEEIEDEETFVRHASYSLPFTMKEALANGESNICEYKSTLFNWNASERNIELEIAKTISGFANNKGGYLFIGITDSGAVNGIDLSNLTKDEFKNKFTRIKKYYLPDFFALSNANGEFYELESKIIFCIEVFPTKSEPVFLNNKIFLKGTPDDKGKFVKEFYLRADASTRILDVEEFYKYFKERFLD
jgi:hypothetical protein